MAVAVAVGGGIREVLRVAAGVAVRVAVGVVLRRVAVRLRGPTMTVGAGSCRGWWKRRVNS